MSKRDALISGIVIVVAAVGLMVARHYINRDTYYQADFQEIDMTLVDKMERIQHLDRLWQDKSQPEDVRLKARAEAVRLLKELETYKK